MSTILHVVISERMLGNSDLQSIRILYERSDDTAITHTRILHQLIYQLYAWYIIVLVKKFSMLWSINN